MASKHGNLWLWCTFTIEEQKNSKTKNLGSFHFLFLIAAQSTKSFELTNCNIFLCPLVVLADKPPIEELRQFFEFQLPRQWAPVFSELPLGPQRRQQNNAFLQFSFMGPKLYVNTNPVNLLFSDILLLLSKRD